MLPDGGGFAGRSRFVIATVQAQGSVPEGGIHEVAMMRCGRIVMGMGPEMPAGDAHPLDWNCAGLLKIADDAHEAGQQVFPFGIAQCADRFGQRMRGSRDLRRDLAAT